MIKTEVINKKAYKLLQHEFSQLNSQGLENLKLRKDLGESDQMIGFLKELSEINNIKKSIQFFGVNNGGYIPINLIDYFSNIYISLKSNSIELIKENVKNILQKRHKEIVFGEVTSDVYYLEYYTLEIILKIVEELPIVISVMIPELVARYKNIYKFIGTKYFVYVPESQNNDFKKHFRFVINEKNEITYNNLLHLTLIVKNSGNTFEKVLRNNLKYIDQWTILDTGSTDNTINIIKDVLGGSCYGNLYEEPFINFRESRNRCLDLAEKNNKCRFTIMLDDTYMIEGQTDEFLQYIRSDENSTSFSMYIKSDDVEYISNRIIKNDNRLRYIYKIHEVIQQENNDNNIIIPPEFGTIFDVRSDYMESRTQQRKSDDIQRLYEMIEEEPNNPRHLYYLAQTYSCIKNYEKSFEYFMKRINHPVEGLLQEKVDAYFEAARTAQYHLNKDFSVFLPLWMNAYFLDTSRPDPLYFIALYHINIGNKELALEYLKRAHKLGYPKHCQFSLRPTLTYYYLPFISMTLCFELKDYLFGYETSKFFLLNNKNTDENWLFMESWYRIYNNLIQLKISKNPTIPKNPIIAFVVDGGFDEWTGSDILTKGVGGSETWAIEMARYVKKNSHYDVYVFCKCSKQSTFENVIYVPLKNYFSFIGEVRVECVFISRFSEYLPVSAESPYVNNIYMIFHDLTPSGIIIPIYPKLKRYFCLTEFHCEYFSERFPSLDKNLIDPLYYGIDTKTFNNKNIQKIKYRFIYSSFPNRGLLQLLELWPSIIHRYPSATLHIHCDVNHYWSNNNYPIMMENIKKILIQKGVFYHGWTSKKELAESWHKSQIWFYPCDFLETFCLTALEAALTKTLAITNGIGALKNTVGDRGITIPGDVKNDEWKIVALGKIYEVMDNIDDYNDLIEKNYRWAVDMSWENRAIDFINKYL